MRSTRRKPEALEELPAEGDHLDVEIRIVGAEHLDTDLVELAVPAALGLLVPEVRARVPRLPRRQRMVLDERPAHAGGPLRPQRDVTVTLVDEVVHLLGDDVGRLADPREDPDVLEQRGDDLAVAGGLDDLGEHGREASPACGFGRRGCRASPGSSGIPARLSHAIAERATVPGAIPRVRLHPPPPPGISRYTSYTESICLIVLSTASRWPGLASSNSKRILATRSSPVTVAHETMLT